jgi:hypothetical protein
MTIDSVRVIVLVEQLSPKSACRSGTVLLIQHVHPVVLSVLYSKKGVYVKHAFLLRCVSLWGRVAEST